MKSLSMFGEPPPVDAPWGGPVLAKGFRPFFLLAGLVAASVLPIWLLSLAGIVRPDAYLDATYWHAHEMVFGFASAVIAGFLLTAASNWTARETLRGAPLLAAAALFVAARVAIVIPGAPKALVAALDLTFLPVVAVAIARPIAATKNKRNYVMIVVLGALTAANLLVHLDVLGVLAGSAWTRRDGVLVGVDIVVLLIAVFAGRVFPMFTKNATSVSTITSEPKLDVVAVASLASLVLLDAFHAAPLVIAVASAVAAVATVVRARRWGTRHTARVPLLWVLHAGYAFIPLGLALRAAALLRPDVVPPPSSLHALTVGAVGVVTLGMMARVSLGHTGRALAPSRVTVVAFAFVVLAALVRVLSPLASLALYRGSLYVSGSLWTLGFLLFVVGHAPMFFAPRVDGKPG